MLPAACIVPESSARPGWVFPLVALFSPLVYLCPLPDSSPQDKGLAGLAGEERLLALCPPMPAAAAEKLRHLARTLEGKGAVQHGEQLKQLILESLSAEGGQEASSALRRQLQAGAKDGADLPPEAALLWQERLLLLLADQAEREQEELAAALSRISKQHQELLSSLSGTGGNLDDALRDLMPSQALASPAAWQPKRLQAWARLLAQTAMPRENLWYITRQEGLAEQILEQRQLCAQAGAQQACHLPALLLPAQMPAKEQSAAMPPAQEDDCPGLFAAFSRLQALALDGTAADDVQEAVRLFTEAAPAWNAKMRAAVPANAGLLRLQLSILPGASFRQRLQNSLACRTSSPAASANATAEEASRATGAGQILCLFGLLKSSVEGGA